MSNEARGQPTDERPFGSRTGLSRAPMIVLGGLYILWLGVLLWMALFHSQAF